MLNDIIQALLDENTPFPPKYLHRLSDLESEELSLFENSWQKIPEKKRYTLLEDLETLAEADTLLYFEAISRIAIHDPSPRVRFLAIRSLSLYDISTDLIPILIDILNNDVDKEVRAIAAQTLGEFVYLGEIDSISPSRQKEVESHLIQATKKVEASLVKRRAIEALGYSSNEEVIDIIQTAYDIGELEWTVSALSAMGHSYNKRWNPYIIEHISNPNDDIRFEAIRAAGELEIKETVPVLLESLEDSSNEIRSASIWALSQIGGEGIFETLNNLLDNAEDDEEINFLEMALDNLSFNEDFKLFELLEIPELDYQEFHEETYDEPNEINEESP